MPVYRVWRSVRTSMYREPQHYSSGDMRTFQTLALSFILSGLISLTPLSGYGPIRAYSPFDSIESVPTSCAPL